MDRTETTSMVGRAEIDDFLTYWKQTWEPTITYAELSEQLDTITEDFGPGVIPASTQDNKEYISI